MIKLWLLEVEGRRKECSKADQLELFVDSVITITSKVFALAISIFYTLKAFQQDQFCINRSLNEKVMTLGSEER